MASKYIKKIVEKTAALQGVYSIAKKFKKGATLLFYHGAEYKISDPIVQETQTTMYELEQHIQYLKKHCEIISLDYLYECISNGHGISPSQVLLTFDDGYKNNLKIVAPYLKSLDIPFAVFVSTGLIDSNDDVRMPYYYAKAAMLYTDKSEIDVPSLKKKYDVSTRQKRISVLNEIIETLKTVPQKAVNHLVFDMIALLPDERWTELNALFSSEELMSWDEVRELHDSGVTIGSHCHDHAILHSKQSDSEIDRQLKTSKGLIEQYLGECKYFAYPNGRMVDISHYSLTSVKKNNYCLGLTTVPGEVKYGVNPLVVPRLFPRKDIDSFKFVLNTSFRYNSDYYKWCSDI